MARSDSPETLTALGGAVLPMQRGDYRWQIAVTADGGLPGDGLLPTLIHWQCPMHPAQALPPSGCRLMKLEGFHPRPDALREALHPLDLAHCIGLYREDGEAPALLAYLETPRGLVELD